MRRLSGDYPGAARDLGESIALFRDLADRGGQAEALHGLADNGRLIGDMPAAASALAEALAIARELGGQPGRGQDAQHPG